MPEGSTFHFKSKKNSFPFGNKYGYWEHDSEFNDFWPWYFNYGFITNEIKWAAVEKVQGVRDFKRGDEIIDQFEEWGVPMSGNTLLWEVPKWEGSDRYNRNFVLNLEMTRTEIFSSKKFIA